MTSLVNIEGISLPHIKQLAKKGIKTTQALLAQGYNRKGRKELAQATGLNEESILEMVNKADILQVNGVGPGYADLLESAGVDSTKELAARKPEKLAKQIVQANKEKKLVRKLPTLEQIKAWVMDAIAIHGAPRGLAGEADLEAPLPPKKRYIVRY